MLVEINETSLRALEPLPGRWPWPRAVHASVIDYLARAPARVVAYDVLFAERDAREGFPFGGTRWSGAESDAALAQSTAAAGNVRDRIARVPLDLLQFHGDEAPEFCGRFGHPFLKAARVRPGVDLLEYARLFTAARGLLLDAFVPRTHGGTGATFDWGLIPDGLSLPVVLSGGLTPDNVGEAVRRVRPWAVDVSSGVEARPGIKDPAKIAAFIRGVRNAGV